MLSNQNWLRRILDLIAVGNAQHARKLSRQLPLDDLSFLEAADRFFAHWFINPENPEFHKAVSDYLALIGEMVYLQNEYAITNLYPNHSFEEVCHNFYSDSPRMERHLNGLGLAQFLWVDQIERWRFFVRWIKDVASGPYLEIGPGHGLYLETASRMGNGRLRPIIAIDVSQSSLDRARRFAGSDVCYQHGDFLLLDEAQTFNAIAFGEVLEHVDQPRAFLQKLKRILRPDGTIFFTSPVHAPMPDHIIAYASVQDLKNLLFDNGFGIQEEVIVAVDNLPLDLAERLKLPIMVSAVLRHL